MNFRTILAMASALGLTAATATAQSATDPNEGLKVINDTTQGVVTMSWWGRVGRTYFIQVSEDLVHWSYLQVIEPGGGQPISWSLSSSSGKLFARLVYHNPDIATNDPFGADFDGDGVSNWDELQRGTDPLSGVDGNGDGIPDDWEILYFNTTTINPTGDDDGDGVTNKQEYLNGTNPKLKDNPALKLQVNVIVQ